MNYAQIRKYDVTNGVGIRTTLFVSGCTHHCKGCFNKEQQDFNYGEKWTPEIEDMFIEYAKDKNVAGVSILGGEPMQQDPVILEHLFKRIKEETNKTIWVWSGYTLEYLLANEYTRALLNYVDILVDGKFEEEKKDLMLLYRGSYNQRVIDIQATLKSGEVVTIV